MKCLLTFAPLLLASVALANDNFFPLAVGNRWEYATEGARRSVFIDSKGNEYIISGNFLINKETGESFTKEFTGPAGNTFVAFGNYLLDQSTLESALRADLFPGGEGTEGQAIPLFDGSTVLDLFNEVADYLSSDKTEPYARTTVLEIVKDTTVTGTTYFKTNQNQLLRYTSQDQLVSYSAENQQERILFDFGRIFGHPDETRHDFSPLLFPFSWKSFGDSWVETNAPPEGETTVKKVVFHQNAGLRHCGIRFQQGIGVTEQGCGNDTGGWTWRLKSHTLSDSSIPTTIPSSGWGSLKQQSFGSKSR